MWQHHNTTALHGAIGQLYRKTECYICVLFGGDGFGMKSLSLAVRLLVLIIHDYVSHRCQAARMSFYRAI
jgi:hypothetical protein